MVLLPVIAILFHGLLLEDNDNCAFLEGKKVGQSQAYTQCLSPLENSQVAENKSVVQHGSKSYFMQKLQLCSCFYIRNESRRRFFFPEPILIHSPLAVFQQRIFFLNRKTEIYDVTPGIEIESSSLISVRIVH